MPTVISNFLNVIEKGAWTGPFCFVSKVLFFITESKLDSIGSRMRKAPQGLMANFMPNTLVLLGIYWTQIIC